MGASRDNKSFDDNFRRLFRPLCIYALHYVGDLDAAEDIVQECFISLLAKGPGEVADIPSYMRAAVRNRATDHLRRVRPDRLDPESADGMISDDEAMSDSYGEAAIWEALERLPEKRRQIFIMSRRDGMSHEEIASELGISVQTVKNQMSLALSALGRKKFSKFVSIFF